MMYDSLPGYDAWKLATPPEWDEDAEEEREAEERHEREQSDMQDAIGDTLRNFRCDLALAEIRTIVLAELAKLEAAS